ncbi:MAG TPA: bifunctional diguanylate cyclase/phosphodiesterase [Steroidobacteraceae bacterium]|nr:bifunctional diguanylate cyclase/phosphodiesterase [Steroidobacteraceae bacterium]
MTHPAHGRAPVKARRAADSRTPADNRTVQGGRAQDAAKDRDSGASGQGAAAAAEGGGKGGGQGGGQGGGKGGGKAGVFGAGLDPRQSSSAWTSLEPYVQVLRALLPRISHLSVFNAGGELHWSSEMAVDPELMSLIPETLRAAETEPSSPGEQRMAGHEQAYLFWLRRDDGVPNTAPFAVVAIGCRPGGAEGDRRSFSFVHALVKPAIECLRRELMAREEILTLHTSLLEQDSDLEMLLSVSGSESKPEAAGDLRAIIASATEHLKAGLAAMVIPEYGIALVQPSDTEPLETTLVAKVHRHLLSMAKARRAAVIVNHLQPQPGSTEASCRVVAAPILRADGHAVGVLALFRAESSAEFTPHHARMTDLLARRVASIIAHSYDGLTGLLTRPAFEQRMRRVLEESAGASSQTHWSALYIDINRLHLINDNCGMHVGDRVIAHLGELIRGRLPPGALAGRISGDRFAILLPAALPGATQFAEALRTGAEDSGRSLGDGKLQVSISIGIAAIEARFKDFNHAFAAAETACKAANDRGRNRVEVYREADESIVRRFSDINLINDLRSAVAEGRLQLNAQSIVPLGGQGAAHFEILLRMIDAHGAVVGPDHFMSAAHRYQLMPTIDRWVIGRAIEMLRPHAKLLEAGSIVFTINFSGQSLQDAEFTEHVAKLIEDSGINPAALCFELTESAAIGNLAHAEVLMRRLRKLGCNIALDDFGTGLSSLAYLRTLPIGMLKIDGSFVRDVLKDPRAESMVQTIAQLARAMSLTTVAEYVETEEIRTRVTGLGVDYGQGFAIAKPEPLTDVLAELPLHMAAAAPGGVWPPVESVTLASEA